MSLGAQLQQYRNKILHFTHLAPQLSVGTSPVAVLVGSNLLRDGLDATVALEALDPPFEDHNRRNRPALAQEHQLELRTLVADSTRKLCGLLVLLRTPKRDQLVPVLQAGYPA